MNLPLIVAIIIGVVALLIGGAVGVFMGINIRKKTAEQEIGSAEAEAKRIVADAIKTAEAKKKEYVLEGKDEVHRFRNESEKEIEAAKHAGFSLAEQTETVMSIGNTLCPLSHCF